MEVMAPERWRYSKAGFQGVEAMAFMLSRAGPGHEFNVLKAAAWLHADCITNSSQLDEARSDFCQDPWACNCILHTVIEQDQRVHLLRRPQQNFLQSAQAERSRHSRFRFMTLWFPTTRLA